MSPMRPTTAQSAVTVTVSAAPAPDQVVDTPTVSEERSGGWSALTVRNQGAARSNSTTLRYYQSSDATVTIGDTEVGTDSVFGLAASWSGDESISLTAPSAAGTYYYGACVDSVSDETDTTNNCSAAVTVTVGAGPAPDLVVDTPTVSESAPAAGGRFTLSAIVRNQGAARSAFTTLRYYQSSDSTITTGDTEVGTDSVFGLAASGSGNESISLTAPSTAGTYYYGACVDSVSDETDTTNNCSVAVTVTVGAALAPDLVLDPPTVSESAPAAGARFTLSAIVRNQGSGSSSSTTLRYYRSTDATITTSDASVGTDSVSGLNAPGSSPESISLTAPSTAGTYYYGACVDSVSDEADTTNNCSASVTVTVGAAPAPDTDSATTDADICATGGAVSDAANNPGLVADCETLLAAKDTLRGTATLNWSADTAIASWDAVTVSGVPRRITRIDTESKNLNLAGKIPSELGNLSSLFYLRLSNNELTGSIPSELGNLSSLGSLFLWNNKLTGTIPTELGSLSNLTSLHLHSNQLTGSIPSELGNLSSLESLSLWDNKLTGTIPTKLGSLSNLTSLRLSLNQLTGSIPSELGNLTNLELMYLGGNPLTGSIPSELGNLTNLQSMSLGGNRLTGSIPSELGNLSSLVYLRLGNNELTGSIPAELGNLTKVIQLWLHVNQLTGTIPAELGGLTNLTELFLGDNQLTGTIPAELGGLTNVTQLRLHNNRLTGEIPSELANLSSLWQLSLANNQLTGCIPEGLRDVAAHHDLSSLGLPDCNASTAPGAPTGLSATADGQTEIDLSWTAPSDDGGADITGYKIEVSTNGSSWSNLVANTNSTSTSYSHTGLTAGSTRHYRVSAINSEGTGTASNKDSATTDGAPDLIVSTFTVRNSSPVTGQYFTMDVTVNNQGIDSSESTTLRYFRSTDATITTSDASISLAGVPGFLSVDALSPSGSVDKSASTPAPSTPGTYYYGACVGTVTGESDTTNNCSPAATVTVQAAVLDLVVDTPTVSQSTLTAGFSFTLSFTVRNQGNHSSGPITLRYYRSDDAEFDDDDTLVGTQRTTNTELSSDGERSFTSDRIPAHRFFAPSTDGRFIYPYISIGTHYYIVCAGQGEGEFDTTNNCSTGIAVTATSLASLSNCIVGYVLTPLDECLHQGTLVAYGEIDAFNSGLGTIYFLSDVDRKLDTITRSVSGRGPGNRQTTVSVSWWAANWFLVVKSVLTSAGNERITELSN